MLPQYAHWCSIEIGGDDNEPAGNADFDDCFSRCPVERDAGNDTLDFTGFRVALTLFDSPREDDVFEIENGEVFIF